MALPDTLKIVRGTAKIFANSGEYSPSDTAQPGYGGTPAVTADIDLNADNTNTGLRANYLWQSAVCDLGSANLDVLYEMHAYIEVFSPPTAGGTVDFYLGFSDASSGNEPANLSGSDAVYNGYGAANTDAIEALPQLEYIGSLVVTADTAVHSAKVGTFMPKARYCYLVVHNNTSVALCATDAIETAVVVTPLQHQIQD